MYKNKVCLYIFTHNITGLKYFGKTTRYFTKEDLQENYSGSGIYWNRHLNKFGKDLSVEIYGIYNLEEVEEIAIKFSKDNNIVKAINGSGDRKGKKVWANERFENGLDGNIKGTICKENTKEKISKSLTDETNGLSISKIASIKAVETRRKNNSYVSGRKKSEITMKKKIVVDGKETTRQDITNKKISETKKKKILLNGIETNIASEANKLRSETIKNTIIDFEGTLITKEEASIIKANRTKYNKGKKYNIIKEGKIIFKNVPFYILNNISQGLTKIKTMGDTPIGKKSLIRKNKKYLIGVSSELSEDQSFYIEIEINEIIKKLKGLENV